MLRDAAAIDEQPPVWRAPTEWLREVEPGRNALARATGALARSSRGYQHLGRGPALDTLGFVRAAVQAAVDHAAGEPAPPLADVLDYPPADHQEARGGPGEDVVLHLLSQWGLRPIPLERAEAGDVLLFRTPVVHLAVLTHGPIADHSAQIAHCLPPHAPAPLMLFGMGGTERAAFTLAPVSSPGGGTPAPARTAGVGAARPSPSPAAAGPRHLSGDHA